MKSPRSQSDLNLRNALIDCSIDAIIAIDHQKNIIAWNKTAENSFDRTRDNVMGKPILHVIPTMVEDVETHEAIEHAMLGYKSFVPACDEFRHRVLVETHFTPLEIEGEIIGIMILIHDVSHRIKSEEQLKLLNAELQNRLRQLQVTTHEMTSFANIASNNIKEPIRYIYTAVEHLIKAEGQHFTDSGKASFRRIQSSLNRMNLMLDDVLTLARIDILKETTELVDIEKVIAKLKENLGEKIKDTQAFFTIGSLCYIRAHEDQLFLLLYHLVDNAIKFNKNHPPVVHIDCQKVSTEGDPNIKDEKWFYRLSITDNGIGIAIPDIDKTFRLFERLNGNEYKGSGLGLAVVHKIMDAHAGFIIVDSTVDNGSSFKCYFPA